MPVKIDPVARGKAIREAREVRGWSLRKTAKLVGTSATYLHEIEHGRRDGTRGNIVPMLIELLGMEDPCQEGPTMHLYAQSHEHGEAIIMGNRLALVRLRSAIDRALSEGYGLVETFASDGEGYDTYVVCDNTPWKGEQWDSYALPYAEPCRTGGINPWTAHAEPMRKLDAEQRAYLDGKYQEVAP